MMWLVQLLGLGPGILSWLNKKTDADLEKLKAGVEGDTKLGVEDIRARIELTRLHSANRDKDREHWSTRWMVPTAFAVFMGHAAYVVADSVPWFGWHSPGMWRVAALPSPYAEMQVNVILATCGIAAGANVIKRVFVR